MFFFKKKKNSKSYNLKIPNHIAIIMDGNARWAKSKNFPLKVGHKIGSENLQKIPSDWFPIPKTELHGIMHLNGTLEKDNDATTEKSSKKKSDTWYL